MRREAVSHTLAHFVAHRNPPEQAVSANNEFSERNWSLLQDAMLSIEVWRGHAMFDRTTSALS